MVIETLTFRLAPGGSRDDFLAADRAWQTELIPNRAGFIRRTTASSDDGRWLVTTFWWTRPDAEAFVTEAASDEIGRRFFGLVDPETIERNLYTTLD